MATVKVKFRASSLGVKEGIVFYQVIHRRVVRQIRTGYRLYPTEWDTRRAEIILPLEADLERRSYLLQLRQTLSDNLQLLSAIISKLEQRGKAYTADEVKTQYDSYVDNGRFIAFAYSQIRQLVQIGKERTADTYTTSLNSFIRFRGNQGDVALDEVNTHLMVAYETYLRSIGVCANTSSYYMRNLRAIYNRAVEQNLTLQRYPFKHVYTGVGKTVKRAVPLTVIRQIRDLELSAHTQMDYARDIFMFSFYTRGMSFIDMAYLKKKDLQNGILSYRRQKTNQQLFIKWEKPMQDIVDKYNIAESPYLLPVIRQVGVNERRQYINSAHLVNHKLKGIGKRLGLSIPLTMYVARHGWASIAKSKNIPVSTISEAMGHDSESTTRIYLASLDTSVVDKANSLILDAL